mmetsp:Transcript_58135/g.101782  ORF Transcript_58135/g.101782 Transcript_58135/m.101782 type:complete len:196 (+) Transcript_58135:111-698(+)
MSTPPPAPVVGAIVLRSSGSTAKVKINTEASNAMKPIEKNIAQLEKIDNKFGSSAGAGSDFFNIYRRHRNHELERLEQMDKDAVAIDDSEAFQAAREAKAERDAQVGAAKRNKRQRRKQNEERNKKLRKEAEGVNQFSGDGSFLEAMMKMSPEELEAKAKEASSASSVETSVPKMPVVTAKQMDSSSNIIIRDVE